MMKRLTLLRRRPDLTVADFRRHWAEPHAAIARGFTGLVKYNQNRVDEVCYQSGRTAFQVDGIVELWFTSQAAVDANRTSATTAALVEDEPRFLSGLTALSAGEAWATEGSDGARKFMALATAEDPRRLRRNLCSLLRAGLDRDDLCNFAIEQLSPAFTREVLWSEPEPPNLVVTLWTNDEAAADRYILAEDAVLRTFLDRETAASVLYAVDELQIV